MSRPTIIDVARRAGVSKSTVSRVLSGQVSYMRPETRARVLQAIEELNYRPNSLARSLILKRSKTVGLLISDVGNPFYSEVIHGVESVALEQGYAVYLFNVGYDLSRGLAFADVLIDKRVDGVILMSSSMSDELVFKFMDHEVPTVVLDWNISIPKGALGLMLVDFAPGIEAAAEHLVSLGHRRFAHISGPLSLRTSCLRRDAFIGALAARGVRAENIAVIEGNLCISGGRQALEQLVQLPERPTAVFCANDLTAMGVIFAARDAGLRVPQDLSVVGLDDIQLAAEIDPPLTTVSLPRHEIGAMCMRMLIEVLNAPQDGRADSPLVRWVTTGFVIRGSTAPPL